MIEYDHKTTVVYWDVFAKRELEILNLAAHGYTNSRIADKLCIGLATVETNFTNMYSKAMLCELDDFANQHGSKRSTLCYLACRDSMLTPI